MIIQCMYNVCTVIMQCLYSVQCMYNVCTVIIQCLYSVQYLYSVCTLYSVRTMFVQ